MDDLKEELGGSSLPELRTFKKNLRELDDGEMIDWG